MKIADIMEKLRGTEKNKKKQSGGVRKIARFYFLLSRGFGGIFFNFSPLPQNPVAGAST